MTFESNYSEVATVGTDAKLGLTNWQAACFDWNNEMGLVNSDVVGYIQGKYDKENASNDSYVPSTQEMPLGWN